MGGLSIVCVRLIQRRGLLLHGLSRKMIPRIVYGRQPIHSHPSQTRINPVIFSLLLFPPRLVNPKNAVARTCIHFVWCVWCVRSVWCDVLCVYVLCVLCCTIFTYRILRTPLRRPRRRGQRAKTEECSVEGGF